VNNVFIRQLTGIRFVAAAWVLLYHLQGPLNNLGLLLSELGRYNEAMPLLEDALEARRDAQGPNHPETLTAMNNFGALLKAMGRYEDALPLYAEALETRRAVLGDTHPDTLASINNLASLLQSLGKHRLAETLLEEVRPRLRSECDLSAI
jgi:tetratricopeptide (TPR) repeat protein